MLLKAPGKRQNVRIAQLTEYVDIYPTLCELAGLPVPEHTDGNSFAPLLDGQDADWKDAVSPRWKTADAIQPDRYTYTEWYDREGVVVDRMLYDRQTDPDENRNVAELPEYAEVAGELSARLQAQVAAVGVPER